MTMLLPQPPPKRLSFGQKLNQGVGRGLEIGSQLMGEYQKKQQMAQSNEALAKQYGIDLSGISDPEERKIILQQTLQGQNKGPSGGLSGQAVPQDVSQAMNKIVQQFPEANADQLKMMMDEVGVPPTYSNSYVENRRRQDERMQASKDKRLESGHKRAEKVLDKADALGLEIPMLESSVMAMEDAVTNGDQSFWSLDNLAEQTGMELFRTAKGGQFKTAAKTYFINDLKASGARPNQFLEKMLADALAKVGRSEEANQTVLESFKFSNDLKKMWHSTARDLEKNYEESLGYLPSNFSRKIEDVMEPYIKDRQGQYEKRLKELAVQEKKKAMKSNKENPGKLSGKMIDVIGPDGQSYEIDQSEVEMLPEGYRVI